MSLGQDWQAQARCAAKPGLTKKQAQQGHDSGCRTYRPSKEQGDG